MFDCPNCGEPVHDESSFCPHCGSDSETGWHPEAEYLGLDLPDFSEDEIDEEAIYPEDPGQRFRKTLGHAAVVLCFVLFVSVGYHGYGLVIVAPAVYLVALTLIVLRLPSIGPGLNRPRRQSPPL